MREINYNYHTHTYRCSHASGTEREYIKRAVDNGVKFMGFSDHVPLKIGNYESRYRVPEEKATEYVSFINKLKEEFKEKIEISVGFEMEYYPEYFNNMLQSVKKYGAQYLILGQHFLEEESKGGLPSTAKRDNIYDLKKYVSLVIEAMETGVFTYLAHPDVFNFSGDKNTYLKEMEKICVASKKLDIPLEINFLGIKGKRHYPNPEFWKSAGRIGCPVTFGFDAHDVNSAFDGESLIIAEEMVENYNLNYIGKPKLIII